MSHQLASRRRWSGAGKDGNAYPVLEHMQVSVGVLVVHGAGIGGEG